MGFFYQKINYIKSAPYNTHHVKFFFQCINNITVHLYSITYIYNQQKVLNQVNDFRVICVRSF